MGRRTTVEGLASIMRLVATGGATSRAAIARASDTARSTAGASVDFLLESGLLREAELRDGSRGRPVLGLQPGHRAGLSGVIDFQDACTTVGVGDVRGRLLASTRRFVPLENGPETALGEALEMLQELLDGLAPDSGVLHHVVVSVAAPVNRNSGALERSSFSYQGGADSSWEEYPLERFVSHALGVPATLENDANVLAVGDARRLGAGALPLMRLQLSYGLGAGIVATAGDVFAGAVGTAGDIGHVALPGFTSRQCWCGKVGCIGILGSLAGVLDDLGLTPSSDRSLTTAVDTLAERMRAGDPAAVQRLREAGNAIGQVAAIAADLLNPGVMVLGGVMVHLSSDVLANVRSVVYEKALPLSTRRLQIVAADREADEPIVGSAVLAAQKLLSPDSIELQLARSGV